MCLRLRLRSIFNIIFLLSISVFNFLLLCRRYLYPYEALENGIDLSAERRGNEKEKEIVKEKTTKQESDSENENNAKRRLTRMQSKNESDSELERRETRSSKPRRESIERPAVDLKGGKHIGSPVDSSDESVGSYLEMGTYSKKCDVEMDSDNMKQSEVDELVDIVNSPHSSVVSEEKDFSDTRSESEVTMTEDGRYPIGARILVKYGKGKLHRAYEAKVSLKVYRIILLSERLVFPNRSLLSSLFLHIFEEQYPVRTMCGDPLVGSSRRTWESQK